MYVDSLDANSPSEELALNDIFADLGLDTVFEKTFTQATENLTGYATDQINKGANSLLGFDNSTASNNSNSGASNSNYNPNNYDTSQNTGAGSGVLSFDTQVDKGMIKEKATTPATTEDSKVTEYAKKLNHPATYGIVTFAGAKWVAKLGWITSIALGGAAAGAKIFYDKSQENKQ